MRPSNVSTGGFEKIEIAAAQEIDDGQRFTLSKQFFSNKIPLLSVWLPLSFRSRFSRNFHVTVAGFLIFPQVFNINAKIIICWSCTCGRTRSHATRAIMRVLDDIVQVDCTYANTFIIIPSTSFTLFFKWHTIFHNCRKSCQHLPFSKTLTHAHYFSPPLWLSPIVIY